MKPPPRAARKTPGLPKDVSVAELLRELSLTQEEELLFLQLPDTLPGQPPTQDIKPVKTEVQNEDGQMVVMKQEKDRVCRSEVCENAGGPGSEAATCKGKQRCATQAETKSNPQLFFLPVRALGPCTSTPIMYLFTFIVKYFEHVQMREHALSYPVTQFQQLWIICPLVYMFTVGLVF